jgi:hypothetical protein
MYSLGRNKTDGNNEREYQNRSDKKHLFSYSVAKHFLCSNEYDPELAGPKPPPILPGIKLTCYTWIIPM